MEEGRLTNLKIREHFLTKLYTMMSYKKVVESGFIGQLIKFHFNKYCFIHKNCYYKKLDGNNLKFDSNCGNGDWSDKNQNK